MVNTPEGALSPHSTKCSVLSVLPPPLSGCICLLAQERNVPLHSGTHTHTQSVLLCWIACRLSILRSLGLFHCYLPPSPVSHTFSLSLFPDTDSYLGVLQVTCFSATSLRRTGGTLAGFTFIIRLKQTEDILPHTHTHS